MEKTYKIKWQQDRFINKTYSITIDEPENFTSIEIEKLMIEEILKLNRNEIVIHSYEIISRNKPELNIYHLFRDDADYGEVESFIIVAENDKEARKIATECCEHYSKDSWLIPSYSVIRNLGKYTNTYRDEPHVVSKNVVSR